MNDRNNEKVIARVILWTDGSVHIVLRGEKKPYSIECTSERLQQIITNPYYCIDEWSKRSNSYTSNNTKTTKIVNKNNDEFEDVKGLTLLSIFDDKQVKIIHPTLIEKAFQCEKNQPIKFEEYMKKSEFKDQKEHWLRLFLYYTSKKPYKIHVGRELDISKEEEYQFLKEVINTSYETIDNIEVDEKIKLSEKIEISNNKQLTLAEIEKSNYIEIDDFCKLYKSSRELITELINDNVIKDTVGTGSNIKINIKEVSKILNDKNQKKNNKAKNKKKKELEQLQIEMNSLSSWADPTQDYLKKISNFSSKIKEFIPCIEEAQYYVDNGYKEIELANKHCLFVEIDLDYKKDGKITNRELINSGKAPIDHKSGTEFNLHHIGQRETSPFAIIPAKDHNGKHSLFHQAGSNGNNLHDGNFNIIRTAVFTEYVDLVDEYNGFDRIPKVTKNMK